jgi:hypothetical protein
MRNLAQVGSVICVVSLVLAFNGGVADAGLSTICAATDESAASLLVQVKDKKWKKKKYKDGDDHSSGQSQDESGLAECTIQGAGGGGCKVGFKQVCEKLKSGKKCCRCVPDKNAKAPSAEKGSSSASEPPEEVKVQCKEEQSQTQCCHPRKVSVCSAVGVPQPGVYTCLCQ